MEKLLKTFILGVMFFIILPVQAGNVFDKTGNYSKFDWTKVIEAIIMVESGGNPRAKSGNSVGAMQITPILVADCNKILKGRNSKKRYTMRDRYSVQKSKEMFLIYQSKYNPTNSIERAIRSWNGGHNYSKRRTQRYFEKVKAVMRRGK